MGGDRHAMGIVYISVLGAVDRDMRSDGIFRGSTCGIERRTLFIGTVLGKITRAGVVGGQLRVLSVRILCGVASGGE